MKHFPTVILGAGPAGIMAAISCSRHGGSVLLCERMPQIGKKLIASGSGRCNLYNQDLCVSAYNPASQKLVSSIFSQFGKEKIKDFFQELGLYTYSQDGRIFPVTNQSLSVLGVLEIELKRNNIVCECGFEAHALMDKNNGFIIVDRLQKKISCDKLILACGGRSYPALGSNGSGYAFAKQYGHIIIEPVPTAVPLVAKDTFCHFLQGQKIDAVAKFIQNEQTLSASRGDVLFTKYGLSGTAVLDISRDISVALNRDKVSSVTISLDMVPFLSNDQLIHELDKRISAGAVSEELLCGIVPNKFVSALWEVLKRKNSRELASILKDKRFQVQATRGWNEAEFTAGGVSLDQLNPVSLESCLRKGLYFCGEILDVDGKRGGYNLAWAWASGYVAGLGQ